MIEPLLLIMDMLECERSKPRIVKLKEGMLVNGKYSSVNLITQKKNAENRIGQQRKNWIQKWLYVAAACRIGFLKQPTKFKSQQTTSAWCEIDGEASLRCVPIAKSCHSNLDFMLRWIIWKFNQVNWRMTGVLNWELILFRCPFGRSNWW